MEKIKVVGKLSGWHTQHFDGAEIELSKITQEEIDNLEEGQEILLKLKVTNPAYYKKGGCNEYNNNKIVYIFPKKESESMVDELDKLEFKNEAKESESVVDELEKLKFKNMLYEDMIHNHRFESSRFEDIEKKFDKLIDIIKELKK